MKVQLAIAALLAFAGSAAASHDPAQNPHPLSSKGSGQTIGAPAVTGGIDLVTTLTPWTSGPVPCSTAMTLSINPGDSFGVCYTVTNHSGHELDWHYLQAHYLQAIDNLMTYAGEMLNDGQWHQSLADGASVQFTYPVQSLWQSTDMTSIWTSQDGPPPAYSFDDTAPFAFIDLTQSPTATVLMSLGGGAPTGGVSADVAMPFPFRFYEKAVANQLCVGFRGVMFVGQPGCNASPIDQNYEQMPVFGSHDLIAPAWTVNASVIDGGTVYADTQGAAPNRRVIVEWQGMTRNQTPGPGITFEVVIDETTSEITFQYQSMAFNDGGDGGGLPGDYGGVASVGIQRDAGTAYTQYSWFQPVLTNGKAIRWTPAAMPYSTMATSTAHVEVLAAAIAAGPAAIQASAAVGASTTSPLTIGNAGNTDLNWMLGMTPAGTGFHFAAPYAVPQITPLHTTHFSTASPDPRNSVRARSDAAGTHQTSSPTPLRVTASVPAYAIGYGANVNSRYLSLDALAPQTVIQVNNNVNLNPIQVGGFLDNDFTKTYLFSNGYCADNGCGGFLFQWLELSGAISTINSSASIAPTIAGELWHGMKWDATTHTAYAVASTDVAPDRTDLYSIDPHLGTSTWIARLDRVSLNGTRMLDIAIAPNGAMYGIDEATDSLYAIDKSSGHLRLVGASGLDAGLYDLQSMDFDQSSGILYYAGFPVTPTVSGIYAMNLATGHATLVGPIGDGSIALRAFAIAIPGGPCANPQNVPWLSFDRSSGTTPAGLSDSVTATLNASGLTDGVYRAKICISSNTPFDSTVALPVTFTVGSVDQIFADGFDSP